MREVTFTAHRPHQLQDKFGWETSNDRITEHELVPQRRATREYTKW